MQRLARQGEPELAAIGCVSAIEWYMNAALGNDVRQARSPFETPLAMHGI